MSNPILQIENVTINFGPFCAINDVSLSLAKGTITGLIGPNGAGKSTLFNSVAGEKQVTTGRVTFQGNRIDALPPDQIYKKGLARTFQIPRPFSTMTVLENLMLSAPDQAGEAFWTPIFRPALVARQEEVVFEKAQEILEFTTLDRVEQEAAGSLSGGQQKLLELARVLMGDPSMILLDEPAAGVNPALVDVLIEKIQALNARGITFLVVEHNMDLIMRHCDPIIALAGGQVIFQGNSSEALADEGLLDAYLGGSVDV
jgi:branched-chain amino acid transport system ATP-binding protein